MILHPLLTQQLAELGLDSTTIPDPHTWQQLLQRVSTVYQAEHQKIGDTALFKLTDDAVLVINAEGRCVAANDAAHLMFGGQSEFDDSRDLAELLPAVLVDHFKNRIFQAFHRQTPQRWSYHFSDDNLTRYQEAQVTLVEPTQALVIVRDITERKWADETARIAREYFRRLIQDLHVGMLIYGPNAELLLSNHRARELFDLNADQIWGESPFVQILSKRMARHSLVSPSLYNS
jgi:PAS domain S-box-containing protein